MPEALKAFDRLGNKITVPEDQVAELVKMGGRVATPEELTEHRLQQEYEQKGAGEKVVQALAGRGIGPQSEAFLTGAHRGLSAGVNEAAAKKALDTLEGPAAGAQYARRSDDLKTGYPGTSAAGEAVGMVGGALGGAAMGPVGAVSAAGGLVEEAAVHGVSRALAGAAGRAAARGVGMAARGAMEGAAYAGLEQASDNIVHDKALGEKVYAAMGHGALLGGALGGAMGVTGSLLASGAKGAGKGIMSRLSAAEEGVTGLAEGGLAKAGRTMRQAVTDPSGAARDMAHEQAWSAFGRGFGLQSTRYAKEAAAHFENGTRDLGEIGMRYRLIDVPEGASPMRAAYEAAKSGTPDAILSKAEAATELVGKQIGEITDSSGARVSFADIDAGIQKVRSQYDRIAGNEHVVSAIDTYAESLGQKLGAAPDGSVRVQDLLEQRKGLDRIVYQETKTLDPGRRVAALREVRAELESSITKALDEASGQVPGELRGKYQALKKDYHGLRIISEAAEDSAARAAKKATFGLSEMIGAAGAAASGHILAAPVLAVGGKLVKERGSAAAAAFLQRAADLRTFESLAARFDGKVARNARKLFEEPKARAAGVVTEESPRAVAAARETAKKEVEATHSQAKAIVKWVSDWRTNPTRFADQLEETAALIGQSVGQDASAQYTASTMAAIRFIAGHIPVRERRDPLDPSSTPPLMQEDADRLVRATRYALQPETILDDFGNGLVTPEGLRAAKVLIPDGFARFQDQLRDHVTDHMLRNRQLTWSRRLLLDKLGIESIRHDEVQRLQANFTPAPSPAPAPMGGPTPPPAPVNMQIPQAGFDAIEARRSAA